MKSQPLYEKAWSKFRDFFPCSLEFDTRMPSEEQFSTYFRFLRPDKGFSTSTLWTTYSILNSVCKGKYSKSLQQYPSIWCRCEKEGTHFYKEEIGEFDKTETFSGPYWLVWKLLVIIAFFGELRHTEVMSLVLEKIGIGQEEVYVVHGRAKQRSDQQSSRLYSI